MIPTMNDYDSKKYIAKPTVNLTRAQYELLERAAKKIGLSVPAYLRSKALAAAHRDGEVQNGT